MNSSFAQNYLESFINHEIHLGQVQTAAFKLDRVRQLLKELSDPQRDMKVIHVAGSKGKGSTCALLSSILKSAGYKVGLYTSPHINHYRERIRILQPARPAMNEASDACCLGNRDNIDIFPDCISEKELDGVVKSIQPAVDVVHAQKDLGKLSFFEVFTALALMHFQKNKVDIVILETGLGGRLDATNAVESEVAVITPISLEHAYLLGGTIAQIAEEKGGIIKGCHQKVVMAPQAPEARDVLARRCRRFDISPIWVEQQVECHDVEQDFYGQTFDLKTANGKYEGILLSLSGHHQMDNAATSICVIESLRSLGWKVPDQAIYDGCENVFWPGRLEVASKEPLVLLDGAHNVASARMVAQTVADVLGEKKVILVLGVCQDKDYQAIADELAKISKQMIFTKADHPRAGDLSGAVDVKTVLNRAHDAAGEDDVILITGSVFVMSEARRYLLLDEKMEDGTFKGEGGSC